MARLFITPREINFINDIIGEIIQDVVGQKIYYFPISELKTKIHEIYNESPDKIFDNPIELPGLVSSPENVSKIDEFGPEEEYTLEVFLQYRDLINKGVDVKLGDFFSYGENFYEIMSINTLRTIYGQVEHKDGVKVTGNKARESQFKAKVFGPTDEAYTDPDAVQTTFVQQRGLTDGSVRDLQKDGVLSAPIAGTATVSPKGDKVNAGSSFYGDDS